MHSVGRAHATERSHDLTPLRAAYQGIAGAYGEEAVRRVWHGRAQAVPARTFAQALDELIAGSVQWAVIPVWNSTIGPVMPARIALRAHALAITIEKHIDVPVRHCLLALPRTRIGDVRFVASHPAALAQCAQLFLTHPEFTAREAFDTAGAAGELATLQDPARSAAAPCWYSSLRLDGPEQLAVIASAEAGRRYGLVTLRAGVQDDPSNITRFVVVRARERRLW